ncbi:SAM and SH3 domain-containing protein 1 [Caerostris extrusa]|uniref:SAM and SH3 domain-containing protein 1 n=1 Tax=Caerostris extrusa TaxID=172846 RepID=A0AAV4TKT6_CAEEX|nr:SAM and SH3 domain-containing protein 1 [Caerostris extrusa]
MPNECSNINGNAFQSQHIYYEPPEEFEFDVTSSLLPDTAGEVIVHYLPTSPDSKHCNPSKDNPSDTTPSQISNNNNGDGDSCKEEQQKEAEQRAYTKEEFTSAILARTHHEELRRSCPGALDGFAVAEEDQLDMGESGVAVVRDTLAPNGQSLIAGEGREACDCERRCSNPKHSHDCKSGDFGVSPILDRRNKGVLGRLRNFALPHLWAS